MNPIARLLILCGFQKPQHYFLGAALVCLSALTIFIPFVHAEDLRLAHATLHYQVYGTGKAILILGGIAGSSGDYLKPVAQELSSSYRCITVDLPGTGSSKVAVIDTSTMNVREILKSLELLRRHLGLNNWIVVGHSLGGMFAMSYAVAHRERVRALVLIGSAGVNREYLDYYSPNIASRLTREDSVKIRNAESIHAFNKELSNSEVFRETLPAYVTDRKYVPQIRDSFKGEAYSAQAASTIWASILYSSYDLRKPLKKYKGDVLQIQGEQDPVDKRTAVQIHQSLKQSRMEFIKDCGHFPWVEQKDLFYQILRKFLGDLK